MAGSDHEGGDDAQHPHVDGHRGADHEDQHEDEK
jgi:hypothetical protein